MALLGWIVLIFYVIYSSLIIYNATEKRDKELYKYKLALFLVKKDYPESNYLEKAKRTIEGWNKEAKQ